MRELLANVEVDELLHGPRDDGREAGGHPRNGQGQQVIKGRIQNLTEKIDIYIFKEREGFS